MLYALAHNRSQAVFLTAMDDSVKMLDHLPLIILFWLNNEARQSGKLRVNDPIVESWQQTQVLMSIFIDQWFVFTAGSTSAVNASMTIAQEMPAAYAYFR